MQAIKEKLHDMSEMRKVKAECLEEEKEEKDLARARMEVAHEVRLAKEAEAAMDLHVNKAAEKARKHDEKHPHHSHASEDPYGQNSSSYSGYTGNLGSSTATGIRGSGTNTSGGPTTKYN